jgi:hypothetical protein
MEVTGGLWLCTTHTPVSQQASFRATRKSTGKSLNRCSPRQAQHRPEVSFQVIAAATVDTEASHLLAAPVHVPAFPVPVRVPVQAAGDAPSYRASDNRSFSAIFSGRRVRNYRMEELSLAGKRIWCGYSERIMLLLVRLWATIKTRLTATAGEYLKKPSLLWLLQAAAWGSWPACLSFTTRPNTGVLS